MPLFSSVSTRQTSKILCCYFNPTCQLQIIRVVKNRRSSLEKVVFPRQRVLFESTPEEQLEVRIKQKSGQILKRLFSCISIQVDRSSEKTHSGLRCLAKN